MAVVVPHEGLGLAQDAALRVAEFGGDHALKPERELVVFAAGLVVEFVADAVEEIVGGFDVAQRGGGEQSVIDQLAQVGAAAFHPGDPADVVVVAHPAAAFFHVRFLEEDGLGKFLVSAAQVLAAEFEKGRLALGEAVLVESLLELGKELLVAGQQAGLDQRGLVFLIGLRLFQAFSDRAAGVADLEADIPQQVEDFLNQQREVFRQLVGGAGQEEEQVDIGAGIERPTAVAADGDQCEHGGLLALGEGEFEQRAQDDIEQFGPGVRDFEAAGPCAVAKLDAVLLDFEEALVEGDPFGGRELALDGGLESRLRVGLQGFEIGGHPVAAACAEFAAGQGGGRAERPPGSPGLHPKSPVMRYSPRLRRSGKARAGRTGC